MHYVISSFADRIFYKVKYTINNYRCKCNWHLKWNKIQNIGVSLLMLGEKCKSFWFFFNMLTENLFKLFFSGDFSGIWKLHICSLFTKSIIILLANTSEKNNQPHEIWWPSQLDTKQYNIRFSLKIINLKNYIKWKLSFGGIAAK